MAPADEQYRRLPGRRRGIVSGASLWMGSDHILLVKTSWFREEYKRFYLRDIQAVVVARCPRFYFSLPMLILTGAWFFSGLFMSAWPAPAVFAWISATIAMLVAWLAICMTCGCRCRIYTAVSRDELASVFRTWTAGRLLRRLQPRIEEVQGVAGAGWIAAGEFSDAPMVAAVAANGQSHPAAPSHTPASDVFVLALLAGAIGGLASAHSAALLWNRIITGVTLLQLGLAVLVLVQYSRGRLGRGMQRVAVAAMLLTGVTFYLQTFSLTLITGRQIGASVGTILITQPYVVLHEATCGLELLLGLIGAIVTLRGTLRDEPDIIKD